MLYLCYKKFLFIKKTEKNAFCAHNIVRLTFLFRLEATAGPHRRYGYRPLHPDPWYVVRIAKTTQPFFDYGQPGRIAVIARSTRRKRHIPVCTGKTLSVRQQKPAAKSADSAALAKPCSHAGQYRCHVVDRRTHCF